MMVQVSSTGCRRRRFSVLVVPSAGSRPARESRDHRGGGFLEDPSPLREGAGGGGRGVGGGRGQRTFQLPGDQRPSTSRRAPHPLADGVEEVLRRRGGSALEGGINWRWRRRSGRLPRAHCRRLQSPRRSFQRASILRRTFRDRTFHDRMWLK